MGLDDSVLPYVGQLLEMRPIYGWGWVGNEEAPAAPGTFTVRLVRLWSFQGERRGGIARVEASGRFFNGFWVVFSTRHAGKYNFADKPALYNVQLSAEVPNDQNGWPTIGAESPRLTGFAQITPPVVG